MRLDERSWSCAPLEISVGLQEACPNVRTRASEYSASWRQVRRGMTLAPRVAMPSRSHRVRSAFGTLAHRPLAESIEAMKHSTQFRLRVCRGDDIAVGPGKVDLLAAIARTGSISAAARE